MAYHWLCAQRKHYPANADIWDFRFKSQDNLSALKSSIKQNRYLYSPLQIIRKQDHTEVALWSSSDALVQKLLALTLSKYLPIHSLCTHVKGHGGHKFTVQKTHDYIAGGHYPYVCKTDIKGYYAHINKHRLLDQLYQVISDKTILNLLGQFLFYSVEKGGNYHTPLNGISRGSALSPLLAGFHLYEMDASFAKQKGIRYLRFMDDIIILCKTRWQLRRAVAKLNHFLNAYELEQHPEKTFIGKVAKGFDWLGYSYNDKGLIRLASKTVQHFFSKLHRLYEQAHRLHWLKEQYKQRVVDYIQRWVQWICSGINNIAAFKHKITRVLHKLCVELTHVYILH